VPIDTTEATREQVIFSYIIPNGDHTNLSLFLCGFLFRLTDGFLQLDLRKDFCEVFGRQPQPLFELLLLPIVFSEWHKLDDLCTKLFELCSK
jgi:hypothetical protein